jgi:Transcriptional regulator of heat shock gene
MPSHDPLNDRQARVLEAVIQAFIQTAEPAASQAVVQRSGLGVSSATVRNTMSELEEKGYLYHPHASAGRIPTDQAYRWYVDNLMRLSPPSREERDLIKLEMPSTRTAVEEILRRAAQVLGVLTQELGVAVGPSFDQVVLERVDLAQVATDRLLLVLNLRSGTVRTIFVQVPERSRRTACSV